MKNIKEGKQIQFKPSGEIMELIERFQVANKAINPPPQITRPKIVNHFLESLRSRIEMIVIKEETKAAKNK